jgi:DNA transformation protein
MGELLKLPNIGKVIESQLNEIGIETIEDLEKYGSHEAWLAIKENDPSACYMRLSEKKKKIQVKRWHNLSDSDKKSQKDFYSLHK